jgi:hypothetical protein
VASKTVAVYGGEWIEGEEENPIPIHVKHRGRGFQMHICAFVVGLFAESYQRHLNMLTVMLETSMPIGGAHGLVCYCISTAGESDPGGGSSRLADMATQAPLHRCTYNIPTSVCHQINRRARFLSFSLLICSICTYAHDQTHQVPLAHRSAP